jgi:hypothetical protein
LRGHQRFLFSRTLTYNSILYNNLLYIFLRNDWNTSHHDHT